jgi:predicted phosphodiesterase
MVRELHGHEPARFLYHLGDVVYPHGEQAHYRPQFFAAYADYEAPIFAVPGNHDGESPDGRLAGFVRTFCADAPSLHDAARPSRPPSRQPHVYWTLTHPLVWIVGLYTNVPEGGQLAADQVQWLIGELAAAPRDAIVIIASHQPVYAVDVTHGSNLALADLLDDCAAQAGRGPDAVFCGHAHAYQRFACRRDGREIPYIVAGAGGYPELHPMAAGLPELPARFDGVEDVTLEAFEDRAHGFMTVAVRPAGAEVTYTAVAEGSASIVDHFRITRG